MASVTRFRQRFVTFEIIAYLNLSGYYAMLFCKFLLTFDGTTLSCVDGFYPVISSKPKGMFNVTNGTTVLFNNSTYLPVVKA
jgi:hypothetical protein